MCATYSPVGARPPYDHLVLYVVVFAASVFVGSLVLLILLAVRAVREVKALGRSVAAASERIADASAALETIAPRERQ